MAARNPSDISIQASRNATVALLFKVISIWWSPCLLQSPQVCHHSLLHLGQPLTSSGFVKATRIPLGKFEINDATSDSGTCPYRHKTCATVCVSSLRKLKIKRWVVSLLFFWMCGLMYILVPFSLSIFFSSSPFSTQVSLFLLLFYRSLFSPSPSPARLLNAALLRELDCAWDDGCWRVGEFSFHDCLLTRVLPSQARMLFFITLIVAVHSCTVLTNTSEAASASAASLVCGMSGVVCSDFGPDCHITSVGGNMEILIDGTITAVIFPQLLNVTGHL